MFDFKQWVEATTSPLEDQIFEALSTGSVSQATFDGMLREWVKETNPALSGVVLKNRSHSTEGSTNFLSGQLTPTFSSMAAHRKSEHGFSNLGLIVQPLTFQYLRTENLKHFDGIGIDNGMFTKAGQANFSWDQYEKMIKVALAQEKREVLGNLYFFTVPDEPFNWEATMQKYEAHKANVQRLRKWGAPVAICIQNGATVENVPFSELDVIFIGGDNAYKEGPEAKAIVQEAQKKGIGVHMGRVNGLNRLNTASQWGVDTADGTHIMHELAKSLHDIERLNPQKPGEDDMDYYARLKRILHGKHSPADLNPGNKTKHLTEPEIVQGFIDFVLDTQSHNNTERRYQAIVNMMSQIHGRPLNKQAVLEYDRFLPQVPGLDHQQDVVKFDPHGNVMVGRDGKPLKNLDVFNRLNQRAPFRPMPEGIPFDKTNPSVYGKYITKYIARMRGLGVMPK